MFSHGFLDLPGDNKQFLYLFIDDGYYLSVLRRVPPANVAAFDNREFPELQKYVYRHNNSDCYNDPYSKSGVDKNIYSHGDTDIYNNSDSAGHA